MRLWVWPRPGVAATAEELRFTHCLEGRCLRRLQPTGRKDPEPSVNENPAKELQAAPLQVPTVSLTSVPGRGEARPYRTLGQHTVGPSFTLA
jgi:hypothetical protein